MKKKEGQLKRERSINMLEGTLGDKIVRFALPLALTGILQQLFNAADVAIVGRFVGKTAMAAVGSNAPIIGLLLNLFLGVSLGANVVIAKYTGRRDDQQVKKAVYTSLTFALTAGFVCLVLGQLLAEPLLHKLEVPPTVLPLATKYLRIYFIGVPLIFLYNFQAAIFRSQGDTRTPLLCLTTSGIINVALNLFFVTQLWMDVDGVAWATVIANGVSTVMLFVFLARSKSRIGIHRGEFCVSRSLLFSILAIGLPAGLQNMVFALSNLVIQSAVNSLGEDVMAASAAAFNIEVLCYFVLNAFGQAATTFIGQNYGAGNIKRCHRILKISLLQNMIATVSIALLMVAAGHQLIGLFNKDPQVIAIGYIRLLWILLPEPFYVLMETFSGALRGYGRSLLPASLTVAGIVGTRLLWVATVFPKYKTFTNLMMAYPISWCMTSLYIVTAYLIFRRKLKTIEPRTP